MHPYNPDIEKILEQSSVAKDAKKAWDVQKYYWDAWYTTVGPSSSEFISFRFQSADSP